MRFGCLSLRNRIPKFQKRHYELLFRKRISATANTVVSTTSIGSFGSGACANQPKFMLKIHCMI